MHLKRPLKNTVAAAGADVLGRLLGFAATAYLARTLGTGSFGAMSIGLSVLGYLSLIASPGLHVMGMRRVAASGEPEAAWSGDLTALRATLALAAAAATGIVCMIIPGSSEQRLLIFLFACTVIPMGLSLEWYFQGRGDIVAVAVARVTVSFVYLLILLLLVTAAGDLLWTAIAFVGANIVAALFLFWLFHLRTGTLPVRWNPSGWPSLLRQSLPLGVSTALSQTVINLPIIIAGLFLTVSETGLFSASLKLIFFALMIDRVFYTLYFPVVARYQTLGAAQFAMVTKLGLKTVLWCTVPITVAGLWLAPFLIDLVYGAGYAAAAATLRWAFPFFLFTTMNTVLMSALYADRQETGVLFDLATGTALLAIASVVFSLLYGIEGTAAGLSLGEAATALLLSIRAERRIQAGVLRTAAPIAAAGVLMACTVWGVQVFSFPLAIIVGCIIFFAALLLFGGMTREDVRFLRERFV